MESAALLMVRIDPPPEIEEEFNAWYETEHVPDRLAVPGIVGAHRFVRDEAPRFLALYDVASPAVFDSEAYVSSFEGKRRTPWTKRMGSKFRKVDRRVYRQRVPGDARLHAAHAYVVIRTFAAGTGDAALLRAHVLEASSWPETSAYLFEGLDPNSSFAHKLSPGAEKAGQGELMVLVTSSSDSTQARCRGALSGGEVWSYSALHR